MGMLDDVKSKKKQKAAENWMKMADSAKTLEKQIEYYTKSLDIDPYNAEAWFKKGRGLEKLGRFEEAKKSFDLAIEIDPDYQGLIGKKYESTASPAPSVAENISFVAAPPTPVVADEKESDEQWTTETPEPAVAEEPVIAEESELLEEFEYSFRPPVGDESIFSNVISRESDDNGSPSTLREEEEEDVFGSSDEEPSVLSEPEVISGNNYAADKEDDEASIFAASVPAEVEEETVDEREDTFSPTPEKVTEEPSSFRSDENIIGSREPVTSSAEAINKPSATFAPDSKPAQQETATAGSDESPAISGYVPSSGAIASSKSVASQGVEIVDIRIPLNETIKFWAIGIVAMLIVLLISSIL
ncbi:tetratricopeptide repeat protein [Methanolobus mangrovi]|uniref:Tetratricopeptide repeat protein n=1 Tax=Methanolobus mangrovi TaxID=3072977 RepID=A0AA51UIM3_9EURY|nr:tetratricopeptide repeat protein [Methanolobus mangrovi]WMW22391.1 tetratricopeptide repeat protein [Methanolobus mangrovi]